MMQAARANVTRETRETFWRTLQTFCVTRIVIAVVLLVYFGFNAIRGAEAVELTDSWELFVAYGVLGVVFALSAVYWQRQFIFQLLVQLMVDIGAISLLYVAAGGARSGLAILFLFPLAGAAVLAPLVLALFFVSVVTLIMLSESGYQLLHSMDSASPSRAGLYGAAFFAAIFVINRLAAKLIKQENLAAQRGNELQVQEAINRMIIADMGDGILVVGPDSEVFAGNPAAGRMLGLSIPDGKPGCRLTDFPALMPIADAFFAWRNRERDETDPSTYIVIKPGDTVGSGQREHRREFVTHVKLRFGKVETPRLVEDRSLIFVQDVTEIENQAQQLKLASMGRLTASIAHEVRNPLSAIAHAASLLKEDTVEPTQERLLNIVGDNVIRLNRMIEDILKLSRKAQTHSEPLELGPFLAELIEEFVESHGVPPGVIRQGNMAGISVRFDPLHLREVVVNLLSNALRYASGDNGSIRLEVVSPQPGRPELHVQDDGPAITPEIRAHLFEPFYTTSSKGTGLGLYVARELCLNNGAMLDYEYRMGMSGDEDDEPSGRFVISFAVRN
ncbi:MAG TPA: ATP-binding protein [Noviherbaspirillum sp.]|nr:ATP-binding protein [Noviherbaspirillum sp.]HZW20078.1 ATP-binding protein [Noviherbaspirillum sp.]